MLGSSEAVAHKATRRARQGQLARCWLVGIAVFIVNLCFVKTDSVAANKPTHYKQYAFLPFLGYTVFNGSNSMTGGGRGVWALY